MMECHSKVNHSKKEKKKKARGLAQRLSACPASTKVPSPVPKEKNDKEKIKAVRLNKSKAKLFVLIK